MVCTQISLWIMYALFVNGLDISKERGHNITFICDHRTAVGVSLVYWYCTLITEIYYTIVTVWTNNTQFYGFGHWENRASINPSSGDLTIYNLTMNDVGTYFCKYDTRPNIEL